MHRFSNLVRFFSSLVIVSLILSSTPFATSAPLIANAATCVDTVTASQSVTPLKINTNNLTKVTQNTNAYTVQFGSGSNTDQASLHFELGSNVDTTKYSHLTFTFQRTGSLSGISSSQPLLVQMYDSNWTNGKSNEISVANALSGNEVKVNIPLSQFNNGKFNATSVKHVFFRLPKIGVYTANTVLKNVNLTAITCVETTTQPPVNQTQTPAQSQPPQQALTITSVQNFNLPSTVNHNGLTSYSAVNSLAGAFNVNFKSGSISDQAHLHFPLTSEFDSTSFSHIRLTFKVTGTSGAIDTVKPILLQMYDNFWTSGASKEVALNSSVLSGQQVTVLVPLSDFNNGVFNPKNVKHLFIKLPKLGIATLNASISNISLVKQNSDASTLPQT